MGRTSSQAVRTIRCRLWDVESAVVLHVFQGHSKSIIKVSYSPDGSRILTCAKDNTIRLWDVARRKTLRMFSKSRYGIVCAFPIAHRTVAAFYYGDVFPNTYYLKMGAPLWDRLVMGMSYSWGVCRSLEPFIIVCRFGAGCFPRPPVRHTRFALSAIVCISDCCRRRLVAPRPVSLALYARRARTRI